MTTQFKFSFSGDGIEDLDDNSTNGPAEDDSCEKSPKDDGIAAKHHPLDELLAGLPDHISYSCISIPISSTKSVKIPRRELFDVKMQLMSEDTNKFSVAFTDEDIRTNLYEGGLKSWECSIDLVKELTRMDLEEQRIIELGCGTALPSLYIFQTILRKCQNEDALHPDGYNFTLADYNYDVLRLVTLPNILLSFLSICKPDFEETSDIDITAELVSEFRDVLSRHNISMNFISGSWSEDMSNLLHEYQKPGYDLILASETIYSPKTMPAFSAVLASCLTSSITPKAKALVAAKTMYFGVGGNLEDFKKELQKCGCSWDELGTTNSTGVGRIVGQVMKIRP